MKVLCDNSLFQPFCFINNLLGKFSARVSLATDGDKTWLCLVCECLGTAPLVLSRMGLVSQREGEMGPDDQSEAMWRVSGDKVEWSLDTGPG